MHITTRKLTAAAVTGAAYAALTMLLAPISYGAIQCRVSEVLCILPFFIPCTAWGLFAGCAIANLLSAAGIFDVVFGSLATLIGALGARLLRRAPVWMPALPTVLANTLIVPPILVYAYRMEEGLPYLMLTVGLGELLSAGVLGTLLNLLLKKRNIFRKRS